MSSLFENQTMYSRKLFMESQQAAYLKNRKSFRMFLLTLSVVFMISALIVLGIYLANSDVRILIGAAAAFVLSGAFFALYFQAYRIRANSAYKTSRALSPTGEHNYSVFSEKIDIVTSLANRTIPIEQISKIFETKNTCCIMVQKKIFVIAKEGFTKGTFPELREFLIQTCGKKYIRCV